MAGKTTNVEIIQSSPGFAWLTGHRFTITDNLRQTLIRLNVRFSNRPVGVKRFQTIHHYSVDVAHGLVLLFGIGTKALPLWDSRTRRNNLWGGVAV